jgi:hypothetical protein
MNQWRLVCETQISKQSEHYGWTLNSGFEIPVIELGNKRLGILHPLEMNFQTPVSSRGQNIQDLGNIAIWSSFDLKMRPGFLRAMLGS